MTDRKSWRFAVPAGFAVRLTLAAVPYAGG
jgi:hypothetical protein